jgi:hypothetical protein
MRRSLTLSLTITITVAALASPLRSVADEPPEERALEAVTIPGERSPSPKMGDWSAAVRVRPTRLGAGVNCRVEVVREWMRVRCSSETFAISLLGGDYEGIAYWIDPVTKDGEVLMPLRRGGKHVFQLWKAGKDRAGAFAPEPTWVVQEYWLEGAPAPTLTIL